MLISSINFKNNFIYWKNVFLYSYKKNIKVPSGLVSVVSIYKSLVKYFWINYFLQSKISYLTLSTFFKSKRRTLNFAKYFFSGLGFKMFVINYKLFVWVGLTHYTILNLPSSIKIYAKKKRIYIVSKNRQRLKLFLNIVRKIKKKDIYKGKGLLEIKNYKGFIKMKTGKRKQY